MDHVALRCPAPALEEKRQELWTDVNRPYLFGRVPAKTIPPGCTERVRSYLREFIKLAFSVNLAQNPYVRDEDKECLAMWLARAQWPPPSAGSAPSLSQPALSLSLTGPSLSPAVPTSTNSSTGLPPSQPSLSSNWRRRASSPVLALALPLPRYPKQDNRVQMGHAEDLPIQQDVTMDGRLPLDFAP
jgi:hypothetical protein